MSAHDLGEMGVKAIIVYHETGLTPRQLADQRKELLEALRRMIDTSSLPYTSRKRFIDAARAAIARAQGGEV